MRLPIVTSERSQVNSDSLPQLKPLAFTEGLQFVKRFAKKRVELSKLWKHSMRITHLATVLFCSIAVMETIDKSEAFIRALLEVWFPLHDTEKTVHHLICSVRRIVQIAISASHIYIFCEAMTNVVSHFFNLSNGYTSINVNCVIVFEEKTIYVIDCNWV